MGPLTSNLPYIHSLSVSFTNFLPRRRFMPIIFWAFMSIAKNIVS